jgi:hypothetical protein
MAHLWLMYPRTHEPVPLLDSPLDIDAAPPAPASPAAGGEADASRTLLVKTDATGDAWCLVAGAGAEAFVNGQRVVAGIRFLRDRDEIRLPLSGRWYYYGTERLAQVMPFPLSQGAACPRCRQPVLPAAAAVQCPGCGLWHHESAELPCWSYADTCAMCSHSTQLDAGYRWTPEAL